MSLVYYGHPQFVGALPKRQDIWGPPLDYSLASTWGFDGSKIENENPDSHNGITMYFFDGKTHRSDGPAIIWGELKIYCLNGLQFDSVEEWLSALTSEQKHNFIWKINEV